MRRGVCVKCESTEIYSSDCKPGGQYQDLWLGGQTAFSQRSSYFLSCAACGYTERYVHPEKLDKLPKYGRRV